MNTKTLTPNKSLIILDDCLSSLNRAINESIILIRLIEIQINKQKLK